MTVEPTMLAFAAVVMLGYTVQTVSGFGSMLVCVTLGALLLPIRDVVTLAVPVSLLQTGYIAIRHSDGIRWRLLLTRVLPLMGVGMAVGMPLASRIQGDWLRYAFAVMVLVLAGRELWMLHRARTRPAVVARPIGRAASVTATLGAGVVHGIYATGGPLLVYALGRAGLDKKHFRSTLSFIWLVLNTALAIGFVLEGRYGASSSVDLLVLLPAVPLGIVVGELIHNRVDEHRFRILVFALLVVAALTLLAR